MDLKEQFKNLSIEDQLNLEENNEFKDEHLFKDTTIIYCDNYNDIYKLLTKTECTSCLSKLTRSFKLINNICRSIYKLELIGNLNQIYEETNFFEYFINLELLEIFEKNEFNLKFKSFNLKLKNLKKLILHFYCDDNKLNLINLDTPSLNWLRFNFNPNKLNILNLDCINILECDDYFNNIYLPNLSILYLSLFSNYTNNLFNQFPKLKEIHFLDCDQLSLQKILNESNNKIFDIYQNNIKINEFGKQLKSYSVILDKNLLKIYNKYESKLANRLHFIKDIQLNFDLINIPESLFNRIECISHIKVIKKPNNLDLWIKLICSCKKLGSIRFKKKVEQIYLDVLPLYVPKLNRLIIDYENIDNLEFLKELKELTYLSIENELPIEYFKEWLKSYRFVKIIQFCIDNTQFTIEFCNDDKIYLNVLNNVLIIKLDDLINNLNNYKTWKNIIDEMKNFLELDYHNLDNLSYLIDLKPEIQFAKLI